MKFSSCLFVIAAFTLIVPSVVFAEYDVNRIKTAIEKEKSFFAVKGWKRTESGDAWLASPRPTGMILLVGKKNSGFTNVIGDSTQAIQAMLRCMMLGYIGLEPNNTVERDQMSSTVKRATTKLMKTSTTMNGVTLEIEPKSVMGNVVFSCILKPASSN